MEDKRVAPVPYLVYEGEMARQERHIKRLWVLCIIIFAALIMTNAGWIIYESQYEEVVITETKQDGDGINIVSGKDVTYGADGQANPSASEEERQIKQ